MSLWMLQPRGMPKPAQNAYSCLHDLQPSPKQCSVLLSNALPTFFEGWLLCPSLRAFFIFKKLDLAMKDKNKRRRGLALHPCHLFSSVSQKTRRDTKYMNDAVSTIGEPQKHGPVIACDCMLCSLGGFSEPMSMTEEPDEKNSEAWKLSR